MDDRRIEVFIAAAETGSFRKAASRCHCTQSAVTQLINAMEVDLGCRLFERSHSGVAPTKAGEELLPLARDARDALETLQEAAERLVRKNTRVRIGAYASIVGTWLPEAMAAFVQAEPDAIFDVLIGSNDLAERLRKREIDVALCDDWLFEDGLLDDVERDYRTRDDKAASGSCSWTPLADDPLLAVMPANLAGKSRSSVSRDELFIHPYIFNTKYVYARYVATQITSLVKVSADDSASILSMVASGMGVAVLPQLALNSVPEGVIALPLDPPAKRIIGAALPPEPLRLARSFVLFLEHGLNM